MISEALRREHLRRRHRRMAGPGVWRSLNKSLRVTQKSLVLRIPLFGSPPFGPTLLGEDECSQFADIGTPLKHKNTYSKLTYTEHDNNIRKQSTTSNTHKPNT